MSIKIVSDSAANLNEFSGLEFVSVPLHIIIGDREFVDDKGIDVGQMQEALDSYKGNTSTSCQVLMTVVLFVEKINELAVNGMEAPDIYDRMCRYVKHTRMYFSLASLNNLARNGRVNPILAKGVGLLGIRIEHMINSMKECGYKRLSGSLTDLYIKLTDCAVIMLNHSQF